MTSRTANCPSCGAQVEFKAGSSIVTVCPYCSTAVGRIGGDIGELEILGKVAPLAALGSPLAIGLRGQWKGRDFMLVGRLQLDYGMGPWNEWYAAFDDGDWGWVAEAQGKVYLTFPRPKANLPPYAQWKVGSRFTVSTYTLVAVERRRAKIVSAEGDLPTRITPGSAVHYVDVEGAGGVFGTVDFGTGESVEAIYLGHQLEYVDLFDKSDLGRTEPNEPAALAIDLKCPNCGATVGLREPDEAQRVSCQQCEALLAVEKGSPLYLLNTVSKKGPKPHIPLGSTGKYRGDKWTVYAHLGRSVMVEGTRYAWDEYLLRGEKARSWRWLLVQNGHWSWIDPASAGDAVKKGNTVQYRNLRYRHFQTSSPTIEHIKGELYWKASIGERVTATDYVCPPFVLSEEVSSEETVWSLGTYLTPGEVQAIFGLPKPPTKPFGVAPNQPNPRAGPRRETMRFAAFGSAALVVLGLVMAASSANRIVYEATHPLGAEPEVVLSERFRLEEQANLEIEVSSDIDNSWFYLAGALIDESTDQVRTFGVEVSYYHGYTGGESWSEGGRSDAISIGEVPAGDYILRFEPQWDKNAQLGQYQGRAPTNYRVEARSDVFMTSHWWAALFALWLIPLFVIIRYATFEHARWQESDHAS